MSKKLEAIYLQSKLEKMEKLLQKKQYAGVKIWTLNVMPRGSHWLVYFEEMTKVIASRDNRKGGEYM